MNNNEASFFSVYKLSDYELTDKYWNMLGDGEVSSQNIDIYHQWIKSETIEDPDNGWNDKAHRKIFGEAPNTTDAWTIPRYHNTRTWKNAIEMYLNNLYWETWDLDAQPMDTDPPK